MCAKFMDLPTDEETMLPNLAQTFIFDKSRATYDKQSKDFIFQIDLSFF